MNGKAKSQRLDPLPPETTPEMKEEFDSFFKTLGFVPNSVLTMQRKPKLAKAFVQIQRAIWDPDSKVDRGFKRLYLTTFEGATWRIWRAPGDDWNGPDGPGFNQRFIGEISADGRTIEGRWERGMGEAGDEWSVDFPITYVRT